MKQVLYVMQGPSGSGKSTLAKQIQHATINTVICSTDDYHYEDGVYNFKVDKLAEFHQANIDRSKKALDEGKSVIVDNTNIKRWNCFAYVEYAVKSNIPVVFIRVTGNFKNVHGVPDKTVQIMLASMETLTVENVLTSKLV